MYLERTKRAAKRWQSANFYLEAKILKETNVAVRYLLLAKGHLIPPDLRDDAARLIEHYDYWIEKYEHARATQRPQLDSYFELTIPDEFRFPKIAEENFKKRTEEMWEELYGASWRIKPKVGNVENQ